MLKIIQINRKCIEYGKLGFQYKDLFWETEGHIAIEYRKNRVIQC